MPASRLVESLVERRIWRANVRGNPELAVPVRNLRCIQVHGNDERAVVRRALEGDGLDESVHVERLDPDHRQLSRLIMELDNDVQMQDSAHDLVQGETRFRVNVPSLGGLTRQVLPPPALRS